MLSCCLSVFGAAEGTASFQRKRRVFPALEPAAHNILPVCSMKSELPDILSAGSGPPRSLFCSEAFDRLAEIRSVRDLLRVSLVNNRSEQGLIGHKAFFRQLALFITPDDHRIDAHSTACRHVAGSEGDSR